FSARRGSVAATLVQVVDPADPVKVQRLMLENLGDQPVRLRVYAYVEWVLGNRRAHATPFIVPGRDAATRALTARNAYHVGFGGRTAFVACDGAGRKFACDRMEFLGAGGSTAAPAAVRLGLSLSGTVHPSSDPCAVIACDVE